MAPSDGPATRLIRWFRPELFIGLSLVAWAGAKVYGGLFGVEQPNPLFVLVALTLTASVLLAGRCMPDHHVGRASLLLWTHVLALGQAFFESAGFREHAWSWMAMAMLGATSTVLLALLIAQRRDAEHGARVALGVGVFLLLSTAGYCAYRPSHGVVATRGDLALQYRDLWLISTFHLAQAVLVLSLEARSLIAARAAIVLLVSQLVVGLLGALAFVDGVVGIVDVLALVADAVSGVGIALGLSMFVGAAILAWFRREPMPAASVLFLIALLPIFAFTQGPYAPERHAERMPFSEENVPGWEPLAWVAAEDEDATPSWLWEAPEQSLTPTAYVDAEGSIFVAGDADAGLPFRAAWVNGETRVEALRPLADVVEGSGVEVGTIIQWGTDRQAAAFECGPFVDVYWLASPFMDVGERARRRFPAIGLEAWRTGHRRVYFEHACEDDETYEIDADAAPPLRLLLKRQPGLTLVIHGCEPDELDPDGHNGWRWGEPEHRAVPPLTAPSPLALRESPWSVALGLLLGFALALVRMRRSRPRLGESARSSTSGTASSGTASSSTAPANTTRHWPPWLRDDEATEAYFVANSDGSPYRDQGEVVMSAPRGVIWRSFAKRCLHGLGLLLGLGLLFAFLVGASALGPLFLAL